MRSDTSFQIFENVTNWTHTNDIFDFFERHWGRTKIQIMNWVVVIRLLAFRSNEKVEWIHVTWFSCCCCRRVWRWLWDGPKTLYSLLPFGWCWRRGHRSRRATPASPIRSPSRDQTFPSCSPWLCGRCGGAASVCAPCLSPRALCSGSPPGNLWPAFKSLCWGYIYIYIFIYLYLYILLKVNLISGIMSFIKRTIWRTNVFTSTPLRKFPTANSVARMARNVLLVSRISIPCFRSISGSATSYDEMDEIKKKSLNGVSVDGMAMSLQVVILFPYFRSLIWRATVWDGQSIRWWRTVLEETARRCPAGRPDCSAEPPGSSFAPHPSATSSTVSAFIIKLFDSNLTTWCYHFYRQYLVNPWSNVSITFTDSAIISCWMKSISTKV